MLVNSMDKEIISELNTLEGFPIERIDEVETGPDSTGDFAVWVWVMLDRDDVDFQTRTAIREAIREKVQAMWRGKDQMWREKEPFVYVRFRTTADLLS